MGDCDTTIFYYTDNTLDPEIAALCVKWLIKSAGDMPIVSCSQEPMDLGENVCIGKRKRSWLTLHRQLLAGLERIKTKYVIMAEHDCIYSEEHLRWVPPTDDTFYYNDNMWLLQYKSKKPEFDGMFSYWPNRTALSQCICNKDMMYTTVDKRLNVIDKDRNFIKQMKHIGEPGVTSAQLKNVQKWAESGRAVYLRPFLVDFVEHLETEKAEIFKTKTPNIDIRHGSNFTGPKRGKNRTRRLEPWGELEDIITNTRMNAR